MSSTNPRLDVSYAKLESYMKVLAYANRLELLGLLRKPRSLDQIHLTPNASQAGASPERSITRQAVHNHLERLVEAGLVRVGMTERTGTGKGRRSIHEYVVDHARLFAVVEELRKLSTIESEVDLDPLMTVKLTQSSAQKWSEGPKLVLVRGVHEGKAFPLRQLDVTGPRGWVIGRSKTAHVSLEYDPFVSGENAEILKAGNAYRLLDLRTSKNGTSLNWNPLPVGGEAPLRGGDVIGIGRSLLLFRED